MSLSAGKLKHMDALSNEAGVIAAAAMDQRGSLQKSLASAKGVDKSQVTDQMMEEFKIIVTRVLTPHCQRHSAGSRVGSASGQRARAQCRSAARL